jgi:hypothetical protein
MTVRTVVRVFAVALAGILAGIYLGYRLGPHYALQALNGATFVQYQQIVHVHYVTFMPFLVVGALVAAIAWLVLLRSAWRSTEFWLVAVSAAAIAAIAVLTRTISVPLNDLLMTWSAAAPPENLRQIWAPWERVNTARAWLAVGVVVLEAIALNLRTDRV